jgi:hypothetical protein
MVGRARAKAVAMALILSVVIPGCRVPLQPEPTPGDDRIANRGCLESLSVETTSGTGSALEPSFDPLQTTEPYQALFRLPKPEQIDMILTPCYQEDTVTCAIGGDTPILTAPWPRVVPVTTMYGSATASLTVLPSDPARLGQSYSLVVTAAPPPPGPK